MQVGYMAMPAGFRYRDVALRGKPEVPAKHPCMDTGRRAKIFAPFAALKGFEEAVASKEVLYEDRVQVSEEERDELNRRIEILHNLTYNSRMARANRVQVAVTYFVPCTDRNNFAYGYRGRYVTAEGIVWKVDPVSKTVLVDRTRIRMRDIVAIEAQGIFDVDWEVEAP